MVRQQFILCLWGLAILSPPAAAKPLNIGGWSHLPLTSPGTLQADPVVGRLACPPLGRFVLKNDAKALQFEPIILRAVTQPSATKWQYELRDGIFWWDGSAISTNDVKEFLEAELTATAQKWQLTASPKFSVESKTKVLVEWAATPEIGPYFFAGVPLSRKRAGSPNFECGGNYRIAEAASERMLLEPVAGYGRSNRPEIAVQPATQGTTDLAIQYANQFGGTPWVRMSVDQVRCTNLIRTNFYSTLIWNTEKGEAADPELRRLFSQLIPAEALKDYGAGGLGTVAPTFLSDNRPKHKYEDKSLVFDPLEVSQRLDALGFKRPKPDAFRKQKNGDELRIVIESTESAATELLEKVVQDSFSSVGIKLEFAANPEHSDATLQGVQVDSLSTDVIDLLLSFTRKAAESNEGATAYRAAVLNFGKKLTSGDVTSGDFDLVEQAILQYRPVSIIMRHDACLTGNLVAKRKINNADPDWFRQLVY
jgi:ABC-type transport system substrate-binding protein